MELKNSRVKELLYLLVPFIVLVFLFCILREYNSFKSSPSLSCTENFRRSLIIIPSASEYLSGHLHSNTINQAEATFRACGVVAISKAVSKDMTDDFHFHATRMMSPLLHSRERLKAASNYSWADLPDGLKREPFLAAGDGFRERMDGRLDLLLPHSLPFNDSRIVLNGFALGVLRKLFDEQRFELKSAHAITALPGTAAQNWHRDDGPLFPTTNRASVEEGSAASSLGIFAVNVFVSLRLVDFSMGPTEYLLGSHLNENHRVQQELSENHQAAVFEWPPGSIVLMDYRTVHRGGANVQPTGSIPRTLAMLVYGRPWWRDSVNYMG